MHDVFKLAGNSFGNIDQNNRNYDEALLTLMKQNNKIQL